MRPSRLILLALVVALPVQAQTRLSFAPQIGFYIPTEKLQSIATGNGSGLDSLEAGISFGARLGATFGKHLGVLFSGNYVPTTYQLGAGSSLQKRDAKLFTGAGQLMVFLLPITSPFTVFLSGGLGVISRGGVAFTGAAKTSYVSGVFGAGAGLRLGGIGLSVGADLYSYNADYLGTTPTATKLKQKDIHLKFGFGVPFGAGQKTASPKAP